MASIHMSRSSTRTRAARGGLAALTLLAGLVGVVAAPVTASAATTVTAYVTNESDDTVTPIDLATNTPGTPITVGDAPFGIAIASVTVPDSADLAVTIGDSADPVALGDSYTYTATVTNNGPSAATGINATVTTPRRARSLHRKASGWRVKARRE